jgi:hypothetical protein
LEFILCVRESQIRIFGIYLFGILLLGGAETKKGQDGTRREEGSETVQTINFILVELRRSIFKKNCQSLGIFFLHDKKKHPPTERLSIY